MLRLCNWGTPVTTPTIEELLARLEEQQARIELLESRTIAPAAGPVADQPIESGPHRAGMTRRGMVRTAAAGAAGIVGAMLIEPEGVASAADAGPVSFTSSTTKPAVTATNTGKGNGLTAHAKSAPAIHGSQTSTGSSGVGVRGTIDSANGTGTGVLGISPNGTGVSGTSSAGTGVTGSSGSTASGATAVQGTVTSTSPGGYSAGVYGQNNGTGGSGIGVYGAQNGFGWGVYGTTPSGSGVYGYSTSGYGVQAGSNSGTGIYASSTGGVGVDGHSSTNNAVQGTSGSGIGVQGSSSSNTGVQGSSSSGYGIYGSSPNNYAVVGVTTSGNGVYGQVSTANQAGIVGRQEAAGGNWAIYGFGNIGATGTKSAVVPAEDGKGHMTLYCMESPECWFEDFGSARLSGGLASVRIDPEFAQTVHTGEYHVFLQAEGECRGLSVRDKTATGFVVQELGGGTSSAPFAYRIVARRKDVSATRLNRVPLPEAPAKAP